MLWMPAVPEGTQGTHAYHGTLHLNEFR
jgi:hypothetical protein